MIRFGKTVQNMNGKMGMCLDVELFFLQKMIQKQRLMDFLLKMEIKLEKIFCWKMRTLIFIHLLDFLLVQQKQILEVTTVWLPLLFMM
uniref:Uncharacterized protein n=1 Tax=Meloidogyne enterolobii TaxID=390850 RepID=A0A6V7WFF3_MELEN|nr:unnamed protein product [Meloidogyne enterolobii]